MEKEDEIVFYIKKYRELDDRRARDEEMVVLTKLIELDPRCETPYNDFYFNHYYNRGVLYGYLGQDDKAIADYTKAIEINPNHELAWGNRAVSYHNLLDQVNTTVGIAMALKINPHSIHQANLHLCKTTVEQADKAEMKSSQSSTTIYPDYPKGMLLEALEIIADNNPDNQDSSQEEADNLQK